jgi:AraC-like DNA-binding protein
MLNTQNAFVYERALLVLAEAAARLGIHIDLTALAPTRRNVEGGTLVPATEYQAVVRRIFADPRETLGIELAQALPIESTGLWGFLLRSSPTFGDMLQRAERYIRLNYFFTRLKLDINDTTITVFCDHPDPSPFGNREQEVCFFLGQWLIWGRNLVGDHVTAQEVRMRWQTPGNSATIEAFFGCPIRFGANEDALVLHRSVFDLPLPEHTPELTEMFGSYAAVLIRSMTPETTFIDEVREALSEGFLTEATSEEAIARRLRITVRTLHRRLAKHETSFRQLRNELMRNRAEQLLREQRLPIAEVSYLLGYTEPSAFHRAFRRWTGLTPMEWRRRAGD